MVQPIPRVGLALAVIILAAFFGFIVLAAIAPATLAQPVIGAVPLSFVITAGLIVGAILVTGGYVWATNVWATRR